MTYKPDKKTKIKGMRKVKHLSKAQVDVLVNSYDGEIKKSIDCTYYLLTRQNGMTSKIQAQTIYALLNLQMMEFRTDSLQFPCRTKAADEYLLKYHRERVKDFIS